MNNISSNWIENVIQHIHIFDIQNIISNILTLHTLYHLHSKTYVLYIHHISNTKYHISYITHDVFYIILIACILHIKYHIAYQISNHVYQILHMSLCIYLARPKRRTQNVRSRTRAPNARGVNSCFDPLEPCQSFFLPRGKRVRCIRKIY